jgi:hypothetical protein
MTTAEREAFEQKLDALGAQIKAMQAERQAERNTPKPKAPPKEETGFPLEGIKPGMKPEDEARAWAEIRKALTPTQTAAPAQFELEAIRPGMSAEDTRKAEMAILQALKDSGR